MTDHGGTMTEPGELVAERYEDYRTFLPGDQGHARLRILKADPRVRIARQLLEEGKLPNPWVTVAEHRFEIRDDHGRRYIYRIGNYDPTTDTFEMEWPD